MRIIILDHEPFHDRKINHYYIHDFLSRGYQVEYWALCDILPYMKDAPFTYRMEQDYVKYLLSMGDLYSRLNALDPKNDLLIVEIWFLYSTKNIFKAIADRGMRWIRIDYYLNPTKVLETPQSLSSRFKDLTIGSFFKKIVNWGFNRISGQHYGVPDIFYITGQSQQYMPRAKQVVSLDYFDVIEYHKKKSEAPLFDYPYMVFLDIMLLDHPDIVMFGMKNRISGSAYYEAINQVFDQIEKCTGLPIIIASHPKARYTDEFGQRVVVRNKTASLVIHSDLVLTHGSLSVSYALLSKKPIVYLYLEKFFFENEFLRMIYNSMLRAKELFGAKVISENFYCKDLQSGVDLEKYSNYLSNFYCKSDKKSDNFNVINSGILDLMNED